jgi:hypothetical protein
MSQIEYFPNIKLFRIQREAEILSHVMEEQLTSLVSSKLPFFFACHSSSTPSRSSGLMVGRWLCETEDAMAHHRKPLKWFWLPAVRSCGLQPRIETHSSGKDLGESPYVQKWKRTCPA